MSYHVSVDETLRNAARLIRAGAGAVKLEGGAERVPMIEALVAAQIPVMGHLGLTPQSLHAMGGFKVQAKSAEAALKLVDDAKALQAAGCFAVVVEGVPRRVGDLVTASITIPTIGIGAGPGTDGQVLVFHDLLGIQDDFVAKFVRQYADLKRVASLHSTPSSPTCDVVPSPTTTRATTSSTTRPKPSACTGRAADVTGSR